jgi:putative GTP pyrophosphokinase
VLRESWIGGFALEPSTATPDKADFLREYTITEEEFEKSQLDWSVLCEIRCHYVSRSLELQNVANSISQTLQQVPSIHSLKVRVKDPDHLIEKIIRKQLEHVERPDDRLTYADCTPETYDSRITDLVGIRALHLFKEQWLEIHDFIERTWEPQEPPIAYIREGDDTQFFQAVGCKTQPHKFRYRSVHYLIKSSPTKRIYLAELQVRTIFEEAWAEIDHKVRYPRQSEDEVLAALLLTFSLVVGFADELGSFTRLLSHHLRNKTEEIAVAKGELQKKISEIGMGQEERAQVQEKSTNWSGRQQSPMPVRPQPQDWG